MSRRSYVNNAYNRSVGRVGQPVGSHVISSSSGGSSRSSSCSSSSTVHVSGYTKSNGTYVAPHTRSTSSRSSSGCTTSGVVEVKGYTRSDGTYVAPYTRSTPSRSSSSSTSDRVNVSGYTRSDGTYVAPYTRSKQGASASSSCAAVVEPRTRPVSTSKTASRVYVDNAFNRKLGRVGKPIGTHVVSRTNKSDAVRYYSDNPDNRHLDRVGKVVTRRENHQRRIMENYTVIQVRDILEGMAISDEFRRDHEYSRDYLQQQEVEESWSKSGIKLSTDVQYLNGRASQNHLQLKLIPYQELELKQEIGRGGFGVVVAGLWHKTAIAFKRLHYSRMSKKRLDSFLSEVTILSSLDHPHTVKLFGAVADTENSCVGFVMEYLRRSLFKAIFIDDCEFTDDTKKQIISQTTDALVYLHDDKKIAHCDIKSENILLDSNDEVKLADFGLSTVKSATETTQSALQAGQGTPRYSAPEVLRGELISKSQLFSTDIYSLAIVAFELIVEEEPFDGLNLRQLERHVGNGDLRPSSENTSIDDSIKELLYKCWDRVVSNRPKAKEFQEKWRHLMESATIHWHPSVGQ